MKIIFQGLLFYNINMSDINTVSKNVKELENVLKEKSANDLKLNVDTKTKKQNSLEQPKNFCYCAVPHTTRQLALNAIHKNREVILVMREEETVSKKTGEKTIKQVQRAFSRCKKTTLNGEKMCHRHKGSKNPVSYVELYEKETTIIADGTNDYFKNKNGKYIKSSIIKKNGLNPAVQKCLENDDLKIQVENFCVELIEKNTKVLKMPLGISFNPNLSFKDTPDEDVNEDKEDTPKNKSKETNHSNEDDDENDDFESVDSDDECPESNDDDDNDDDEVEIEPIKDKDGKEYYCDKDNNIYEPEGEDSGKQFAKLIPVKYKSSPFQLKRNDEDESKYYIAGSEIVVNDIKYWKCKLANKVYSFEPNENDQHDHLGWIKEKKGGKQVLKLKGVKGEIKL